MSQLAEWQGGFGREYTDRNVVDWRTRVEGFRQILDGLDVHSVLEVGPNRGHNLQALTSLGYAVRGVEPQTYAATIAMQHGLEIWEGDIYDIPYFDDTFDLVFTSGVLIHVPPDLLELALSEVMRVSKRYVLAVEYASDVDTEVRYRDRDGLMWNRDYGAHYQSLQAGLVRSGTLGAEFDNAAFWLLEKSSSDKSG